MRLRAGGVPRSYPHGVDLSGIIFVVLAVGWAGYLIPMALKRHDDEAKTRPVDTFSDAVRVVSPPPAAKVKPQSEPTPAPVVETPPTRVVAPTVTREAARRAARRRR